jgi:hypothetical protein
MKFTLTFLLLLAFTGRNFAADPAAHRHPVRDRIVKHFDTNGDGKLDEAERAKAREAVKGRRGEAIRHRLRARFDEDGDGKLNETERAKAKEALDKFLADGTR